MAEEAVLRARFDADISDMRAALDETISMFEALTDRVGLSSKALRGLGEAFAIGTVIQQVTSMTLAVAQQAEELTQLAQQTGMSTQSLQQWEVILNRTGTTTTEWAVGLRALANRLDEARQGSEEASRVFQRLGIDVAQVGSMDDLVMQLAERLSQVRDGAEKTALATDLLGRAGQRLIPAFNAGAEALREAAQRSQEMTVLSTAHLERLTKLDDAVDDLRIAWNRFTQQVSVAVAPALTTIVQGLTWVVETGSKAVRLFREELEVRIAALTTLFAALGAVARSAWDMILGRGTLEDLKGRLVVIVSQFREMLTEITGATPTAPDLRKALPTLPSHEQAVQALQAELAGLHERNALLQEDAKARQDSIKWALAQYDLEYQQGIKTAEEVTRAQEQAAETQRQIVGDTITKQFELYEQMITRVRNTTALSTDERVKLERQLTQELSRLLSQAESEQMRLDTEQLNRLRQRLAEEQRAASEIVQMRRDATMRQLQDEAALAEARAMHLSAELNLEKTTTANITALYDARRAALEAQLQAELADTSKTLQEQAAIRLRYDAQLMQLLAQEQEAHRQAQAEALARDIEMARARLDLLKAQSDQEFTLFRDVTALREQAAKVIELQYQREVLAAEGNVQMIEAAETRKRAALMRLPQEFPTAWEAALTSFQQSFVYAWGSVVSSFSQGLAQMIVYGRITWEAIGRQIAVSLLQMAIQASIQMVTQWIAGEAARAAATEAANATIAASTIATQSAVAGAATASTATTVAATQAMGAAAISTTIGVWSVAQSVLQALATALKATGPFGMAWGFAISAALAAGAIAVARASKAAAALMGAAALGTFALTVVPFQHGGLVTEPTLGLLGEAGPEAVIPLSSMRSLPQVPESVIPRSSISVLPPISQTIVVELDGKEIARAVVDDLPTELRLRGALR
jgi:hypothetical protein